MLGGPQPDHAQLPARFCRAFRACPGHSTARLLFSAESLPNSRALTHQYTLTFWGQESKMFTTATFDGRTFRSCSPRTGCSPSPVQPFPPSLTLLLLRELPEAVPFILQCCSASLAMSEINFCAAREIKRMLPCKKGEVTTSDGEHCAPWGRGDSCRAPRVPELHHRTPATHMRGSEASKPALLR